MICRCLGVSAGLAQGRIAKTQRKCWGGNSSRVLKRHALFKGATGFWQAKTDIQDCRQAVPPFG